jgi:hypothetical protein
MSLLGHELLIYHAFAFPSVVPLRAVTARPVETQGQWQTDLALACIALAGLGNGQSTEERADHLVRARQIMLEQE